MTGGQVRCWGYGAEGELGYPGVTTVGASNTPAAVGPVDIGSGFTATQISSGDYHTCVIRNDGSVVCWGYGKNGRLGYGNTNNVGDTQTPGSVGPVNLGGHTAKTISAGGGDTCAILDDGSVRCWGYGGNGQLGYNNQADLGDTPADTPNLAGPLNLGTGRTAAAISVGSAHTCAILDDASVRCWGYGGNGRLGYGDTVNVGDGRTTTGIADPSIASSLPVNLGAMNTAVAISAGGSHTCAILNDRSVRCWGLDTYGQLGYGNAVTIGDRPGSTGGSGGPVYLGASRTAVAISAGLNHTCAILDDGSALCWGDGASGRLGYGSTANVGDSPADTPGMIGPVNLGAGRTAVAISAGGAHTCALLDNGRVRCWGYGGYGQLGYCSTSNVGDTPAATPDTAGPVNVVPGDGGELCPPIPSNHAPPSISGRVVAGQTLSEAHGSWSPTPTGYKYQWERCDRAGANCGAITGAAARTYKLGAIDVGSTIRVLETASDVGASSTSATSRQTAVVKAANPDAARERGWRRCIAKLTAATKPLRALTRRGSPRRRAQARRRLARQLASGRAQCARPWGRTPGRVTRLHAITRGNTKIELDFTAAGTNGKHPPAATRYRIALSLTPITNQHDFSAAPALCNGVCTFTITQIGTNIKLTITALNPHTTYYYAIAALDNVTARPGPRSPTVKTTTA